jgi:hypothetical protein
MSVSEATGHAVDVKGHRQVIGNRPEGNRHARVAVRVRGANLCHAIEHG